MPCEDIPPPQTFSLALSLSLSLTFMTLGIRVGVVGVAVSKHPGDSSLDVVEVIGPGCVAGGVVGVAWVRGVRGVGAEAVV